MREILFRGKRLDNGEWVEGYYAWYGRPGAPFIGFHNSIGTMMWCEVAPATVGQYTGLTDKNGKRIFEGDIVQDMNGTIYPVVWGGSGFYLRYSPPHAHGFHHDLLPLCNYWSAHGAIVEIIGNVHDNPELIGGGGDG